MNVEEKIKKNHQVKSNKVKKLERKLKNKTRNTIPLELLKNMLKKEEASTINPRAYLYDEDDSNFIRDESRQEARIGLLRELIHGQQEKTRLREECWKK